MTVRPLTAFCFVVLFSLGCQDDPQKQSKSVPLNFYAFGNVLGKPAYWETAEATMPPPSNPSLYEVNDGVASGDDVYLVGKLENTEAVIWKNGAITKLQTSEYGEATGIFIASTDVYLVGYGWEDENDGTFPQYWKNGTSIKLPKGTTGWSRAVDITVSSSGFHAIGWEDARFNKQDSTYGIYWKNGERFKITPTARHTIFGEIAVSDTDVYIAGYTMDEGSQPQATIWKNGVATPLADAGKESYAHEIVIIRNDVYVGGRYNNVASFWKNGSIVTLETGASFASEIGDMITQGDSLIVSGWNFRHAYAYDASFVWSQGKLIEPFTGKDGKVFINNLAPGQ